MQKNIWTFFIDNFRLTYVIILAIVLFGTFSIFTIPKESSPEVDIPVIIVSTSLPGASARDVEELVTNVIESRIQGLPDVDSVSSVSYQGLSQITVNFDVDSEGREKVSDVRERVDQATQDLPDDAGDPFVQQISFSDRPILTMALSGPFESVQLKEYAEELADEIERISAVSSVNITGAPERFIEVIVQEESLNQFGITLNQITNGLAAANSDIPIGSIQTAGTVYTVRFDGRLANAEDVRNTPIANTDEVPIFVRDVATVNDTFTRLGTISRLSTDGEESLSSVTLQVFKSSGQGDILTIIDTTEELVADARLNYLPEEVRVETIENDADLIRNDLQSLLTSGALTVLIVLSVLILFLGWREALLASLVIPLTFMITFIFLSPLGYTINFLTLFSLILALGILVDASIVVTESMFKNIERGLTPYEAATKTIREFQKPLIAGTLTTVFVFLPMLLMSGIMGKFIESIPITVTIVLIGAIFVSLAIITTLGVRFLKPQKEREVHGVAFVRRGIKKVYGWYEGQITRIVYNARSGRQFLMVIAALFVFSLTLPVIGLVQINMFPAAPSDIIYIDVKNPVGTPLMVTNAQLADIEVLLMEDDRIESFLVSAGSGSNSGSVGGSQNNGHTGSIVVNIADDSDTSSIDLITEYESRLVHSSDAEVVVSQLSSGPESGNPVQVKVVGEDLDDLRDVAVDVAEILATIEGARNVDSGLEENAAEFVVSVNRAQARAFGVSPIQIAGLLRTALSGETATVIKNNGNDIDVLVKYDIGSKYPVVGRVPQVSVPQLESILVATEKGNLPLTTFADINLGSGLPSITHEDSDRVIVVSSALVDGANAGVVVGQLQERLTEYQLPDGVAFSYGGEAEDIAESFTSLGIAMILGIFLIFGLLLWQFNSYRQPLFVLVTIPLALIGVLPGLALMNQPLSFPGFIGVVALAGIVVNNAIILIDSINTSRKDGRDITEAVLESAQARLQPILLTTITTVAGMLPLAFSDPTWSPLALSIIFGLLFSTVLTLFVVPILYVKFGEKNIV